VTARRIRGLCGPFLMTHRTRQAYLIVGLLTPRHLLGCRLLVPHRNPIYLVFVSTSFSPEEIRAAAEIHREIQPEYRDAVVDSFIDRVGKEIDARVDSRLAAAQDKGEIRAQQQHHGPALALGIVSIGCGIPLTAIALSMLGTNAKLTGLFLIWAAIAVINVAYGLSNRPRRYRPGSSR